ncbi:hypothetical protein OB2597_03938 [Pseudooceanicola batsensis HTCC2597]|uniref:Uncharacterized protein n=1 Tax=Pseudooceanicola batsensis (strain ATCC BAA-863 / DSM 15984 / KCTC 12145 / HTCC2597) TaxID=252305 RepID=A3U2I4_PSEBH|nr:DUF6445 family protein [Pseudooceanicola batsensis]EAQ01558.1 hypothetical protein OB2597_03938 [Pseudooceanicola batsensis HTCC2597]
MSDYTANRAPGIRVMPVGRSGEPVLVIDDVLTDPDRLVAAACRETSWNELPPGGYPGRRAGLPEDYVRTILRRIDPVIRQHLFDTPQRLDRFECAFSLVTQKPSTLQGLQRIPHIDIARPGRVAILHYLCAPAFGGTAFFRQSSTGFEQIGPDERVRYLDARRRDLAALGEEDRYPGERTPGYERTGFVEARFNRIAVYRSFTLHSGIVEDAALLSEDPAWGRLTANFFVDYLPRDG